jgi:hypothetical protein
VQGNAPANFPAVQARGLPFTKSAIRLPTIASSKGFDKYTCARKFMGGKIILKK